MEGERAVVRGVPSKPRDQVLRAWLRRVGENDYDPSPEPLTWRALVFHWNRQYGKSGVLQQSLIQIGNAYSSALHSYVDEFVIFGQKAVQSLSTSSETLSDFEVLMKEKQNRQYGPPKRRTHMRPRRHR